MTERAGSSVVERPAENGEAGGSTPSQPTLTPSRDDPPDEAAAEENIQKVDNRPSCQCRKCGAMFPNPYDGGVESYLCDVCLTKKPDDASIDRVRRM